MMHVERGATQRRRAAGNRLLWLEQPCIRNTDVQGCEVGIDSWLVSVSKRSVFAGYFGPTKVGISIEIAGRQSD